MIPALIALLLFPSAIAAGSNDPCSLLPGSPQQKLPATNQDGQSCVGKYPGMEVNILVTSTADDARRMAARPAQVGFRDVPYGDGGKESVGTSRPGIGALTGESASSQYHVYFSCGVLFITGRADPASRVDAQRMIQAFAESLRSQSLCAAAGTGAPPARPVPGEMAPPSVGGERKAFAVTGECVRDGQGLLCTAEASNPPDGVSLAQVRYMWYLNGAVQGPRSSTFMLETLPPGNHTVGVKAFTPNTVSTATFTMQVR